MVLQPGEGHSSQCLADYFMVIVTPELALWGGNERRMIP